MRSMTWVLLATLVTLLYVKSATSTDTSNSIKFVVNTVDVHSTNVPRNLRNSNKLDNNEERALPGTSILDVLDRLKIALSKGKAKVVDFLFGKTANGGDTPQSLKAKISKLANKYKWNKKTQAILEEIVEMFSFR
ncbi:RxLR effector protein [Phytophthora megakarya]|uniref:RxLR effector protein n=1 Tax=Phytophthora megakarya TaxID=4795 RepID=A0A225WW26_9STRA|nr:RxLR effector protein [Phytophthora megakarya]